MAGSKQFTVRISDDNRQTIEALKQSKGFNYDKELFADMFEAYQSPEVESSGLVFDQETQARFDTIREELANDGSGMPSDPLSVVKVLISNYENPPQSKTVKETVEVEKMVPVELTGNQAIIELEDETIRLTRLARQKLRQHGLLKTTNPAEVISELTNQALRFFITAKTRITL